MFKLFKKNENKTEEKHSDNTNFDIGVITYVDDEGYVCIDLVCKHTTEEDAAKLAALIVNLCAGQFLENIMASLNDTEFGQTVAANVDSYFASLQSKILNQLKNELSQKPNEPAVLPSEALKLQQ